VEESLVLYGFLDILDTIVFGLVLYCLNLGVNLVLEMRDCSRLTCDIDIQEGALRLVKTIVEESQGRGDPKKKGKQ